MTRQVGLGKTGSALFSLISGIAVMGWFGVQNALFAQGIRSLWGGGPLWAWILGSGVVVTTLVAGGIRFMGWAAYITVPLFLILMGTGLLHALAIGHQHIVHFAGTAHESLPAAITLVVGSFILGAVLSPDMTRFQRSPGEVGKQSIASFVLRV
ncbi:hypothetical protein HIJ39_23295 [Sulfobacillus sp. DSM 109850]|uniref:Uncharacterized protein n=1 Tax=Sulfobacillus harzensis TaxID=2729629 RepID=A0A7Y0Q6D9_9FIRM|nr:hypothetical protein [Sulfobacillus harzensis]